MGGFFLKYAICSYTINQSEYRLLWFTFLSLISLEEPSDIFCQSLFEYVTMATSGDTMSLQVVIVWHNLKHRDSGVFRVHRVKEYLVTDETCALFVSMLFKATKMIMMKACKSRSTFAFHSCNVSHMVLFCFVLLWLVKGSCDAFTNMIRVVSLVQEQSYGCHTTSEITYKIKTNHNKAYIMCGNVRTYIYSYQSRRRQLFHRFQASGARWIETLRPEQDSRHVYRWHFQMYCLQTNNSYWYFTEFGFGGPIWQKVGPNAGNESALGRQAIT